MSNHLNVIFFGDSICFGQGVSIHAGWVPRLSLELEKLGLREKQKITVINSAVNGNTTRQALERMPYDVQSNSADLILIQFGMNDCNHWKTDRGLPRVSRRGFKANLIEIVERAQVFGASKIILNTNHPTTRNTDFFEFANSTYEQCNSEYNEIIREVAASSTKGSGIVGYRTTGKKIGFSGKIALQDFLVRWIASVLWAMSFILILLKGQF